MTYSKQNARENGRKHFLDKDDLRNDLMAGFHKQFAENQRTRESWFLQAVGYIGVTTSGYAWAYYHFDTGQVLSVSAEMLAAVAIGVSLLLGAGAWLAVVSSESFRRDQYVNARIRRYTGVIGENGVFPKSFDPTKAMKSWWIGWMPEQFKINYLIFPLFQALVFASFWCRVRVTRVPIEFIDGWITATVFLSLFVAVLVLIAPCYYRWKWHRFRDKYDEKDE